MKEIKCRFRAHFDSASQSHSRWFSWSHLREAKQLKTVRRLGLLALFMAGASATMFILSAAVMSPQHVRFQALYGGSGFGNVAPFLAIALVVFSLTITILSRRSAGVEGTKLTMEGQISGTPAYMASEVALGEESLDGRQELDAALAALQQSNDCRWGDDEAHRWWDAHLAMPAHLVNPATAGSGVAPTISMASKEPTQP